MFLIFFYTYLCQMTNLILLEIGNNVFKDRLHVCKQRWRVLLAEKDSSAAAVWNKSGNFEFMSF